MQRAWPKNIDKGEKMVDCSRCIDCGKCTRVCLFLDKYDLNLKDYSTRPDLAYHCYLCGECKRVCPVDIDGRQIALDLRDEELERGFNLYREGYAPLLLEKKNYLFKNYKKAKTEVAFFPGCNFPAYFPKTTKMISKKLEEAFGIATIFDCCGKPIDELGLKDEETSPIARLNLRLKSLGIEELVLVCPNCYYFFKDKLEIKISMVYQHEDLMESLMPDQGPVDFQGKIFLPCPDRDKKELLDLLAPYMGQGLEEIKDIQCCGAGGCASVKEGALSKQMQDKFLNYEEEEIYLYCATCAGMISKSNPRVTHILCKLFDTKEELSPGIKSLKNRVLFALK